jgi:predicted nucleic acid-binding Zn ribbon protein
LIANSCRPDNYDRGLLWVACSGSAWAQELLLRKHVILTRLNQIASEADLFTGLRTRVTSGGKAAARPPANEP